MWGPSLITDMQALAQAGRAVRVDALEVGLCKLELRKSLAATLPAIVCPQQFSEWAPVNLGLALSTVPFQQDPVSFERWVEFLLSFEPSAPRFRRGGYPGVIRVQCRFEIGRR